MSNITRRTALAASAALPMLPVMAYATPADPLTAKVDTALSDFRHHFENLPPEHRKTLAGLMSAVAETCHKYVVGEQANWRVSS